MAFNESNMAAVQETPEQCFLLSAYFPQFDVSSEVCLHLTNKKITSEICCCFFSPDLGLESTGDEKEGDDDEEEELLGRPTPLLLYLLLSLPLLSRTSPVTAFTSFEGATDGERDDSQSAAELQTRVTIQTDPVKIFTSSVKLPAVLFLFKHVSVTADASLNSGDKKDTQSSDISVAI